MKVTKRVPLPLLPQLRQVVVEVARVVTGGAVRAALHARDAAVPLPEVAQVPLPHVGARQPLLLLLLAVLPLHGRPLPLLGVVPLLHRVVGRARTSVLLSESVRVSVRVTLRQRAN